MTDNGDNTYSYDYVIDRPGEVTIHVHRYAPGGILSEWYDNRDWDLPVNRTDILTTMSQNFGTGLINGINEEEVTAKFFFRLKPPVDETYTFEGSADDILRVYIDSTEVMLASHPNNETYSVALQADTFYDFYCEWRDVFAGAKYILRWEYPGQAQQNIPSQYLYYPDFVDTPAQLNNTCNQGYSAIIVGGRPE